MKTTTLTGSDGINPAILPDGELRRLVFEIIIRDGIEPFLRRMAILLDAVRAGEVEKVAQVACQSADPAFVKLMSAVSGAVREGEFAAAHITAFLAASYAYQESLDYYWELMRYLDTLKRG